MNDMTQKTPQKTPYDATHHDGPPTDLFAFAEVDGVFTSGQPTADQLGALAADGVAVVINLAPHNAPGALGDEAAIVADTGMAYLHLPVDFSHPTGADLDRFFTAMDAHRGRRILVHCAANKRVAVFLALYRICRQGVDEDAALDRMRAVWRPNPLWQRFVRAQLARRSA